MTGEPETVPALARIELAELGQPGSSLAACGSCRGQDGGDVSRHYGRSKRHRPGFVRRPGMNPNPSPTPAPTSGARPKAQRRTAPATMRARAGRAAVR